MFKKFIMYGLIFSIGSLSSMQKLNHRADRSQSELCAFLVGEGGENLKIVSITLLNNGRNDNNMSSKSLRSCKSSTS